MADNAKVRAAVLDRETFEKIASKDGWNLANPSEAVTLAAYVVGPNIDRIASFLGRPRAWCRAAAHNLRANGVWRGGRIITETGEPDGIEMAIQASVAAGFLETVRG